MEQEVGFEPTRAKADGLQDRSNQPLWDSCIYLEVLLRFELKFEHYEYPVLDHYTIEPHFN